MPPRTLNCATSRTAGARAYPIASRRPIASPIVPLAAPRVSTSREVSRAAGTPVRSAPARAVVTSTRTRPSSSAWARSAPW